MEGRLGALGRAHDLLMQVNWASASLTQHFPECHRALRQPRSQALPLQPGPI